METLISKTWKFEAAHNLPQHKGKCHNLHGHTYKLEVLVAGLVQPVEPGRSESGMVMDFAWLSEIWKLRLEPRLDHQYLNLSLADPSAPNSTFYPTAELTVRWIYDILKESMPVDCHLASVQLWETESSYAIIVT